MATKKRTVQNHPFLTAIHLSVFGKTSGVDYIKMVYQEGFYSSVRQLHRKYH